MCCVLYSLQQKTSTFGNAYLIECVINTFKNTRSDEPWDILWNDIQKFIKLNFVSVEGSNSTRGNIKCLLFMNIMFNNYQVKNI